MKYFFCLLLLTLNPFIIISQQWNQLGQDIDGEAAEDRSGFKVSINYSGNRVAISAIGNSDNGLYSGHVRVFEWNGINWIQLGQDIDGVASNVNTYHCSLDSSGNRLLVGAHQYNNYTGHMRIFEWNGTNWVQMGVDINGPSTFSLFGLSAGINKSGNRIVISAPNYGLTSNGFGTGLVRVYQWDGFIWNQLGNDLDGINPGDAFGQGLSMDETGDIIAIGSPEPLSPGGSVKLFEWNGSIWIQKGQTISSTGGSTNSSFGSRGSVSLNNTGDIIAIGDPYISNSIGQVKIYEWNGTIWNQKGQILNGNNVNDQYGSSLSLNGNGNRLSVGIRGYNNYTGRIITYEWNGINWVQLGQNIDGENSIGLPIFAANILGDIWGGSVAFNNIGDRIIGGAEANDGNGSNSGHARIYELFCPSTSSIFQIIACNSYTWIDGVTYTSSNNTATHVLVNSAGCDSVVTLDLTINNNSFATDTQVACNSYTWIDGVTYTSSNNTATHVLVNSAGCDSVVTLDLTINNSSLGTDIITACDSLTWIDGTTYTASNNTATYTLINAAGCDSVVTLDLTIYEFLTDFSESSALFTGPPFVVQFTNNTPNLTNYNFTWYFGDSTIEQNNNASVFHEYMYNGLYDVTLIAEDITNGCGFDTLKKEDLIYCAGGPNLSIIEFSNNINVFPNPTNENITIIIENFNGNIQTEVYDLIGHRLQTTNETTISLRDYARGIYLLKVAYGDRVEEVKVIKQ